MLRYMDIAYFVIHYVLLYGCVLAQNRLTESTYQLNIVPKHAYRLLHPQNKAIAERMAYIKSFSQLLCE
jgi:hypothetical protein